MPGTRSGDLSSFERWPAGAGGGDSVPTLDHSSIAFGDADGPEGPTYRDFAYVAYVAFTIGMCYRCLTPRCAIAGWDEQRSPMLCCSPCSAWRSLGSVNPLPA